MEPLSPLLLGALTASLLALPLRRLDHPFGAALFSGLLNAGLMMWLVAPGSLWVAAGFLAGAALAFGNAANRGDAPLENAQGIAKAGGNVPGRLPDPSRWIDPAGRLRLERAIYAVEEQIEIVVVAARRCDPYLGARWRFALTVAGAAWLALALSVPELPVWALFGTHGAALAGAFLASTWPPLSRLLVSRSRMQAAVERRARRAFFEAGLHHAPCGGAALILFATLERRFALLVDDGASPAGDDSGRWECVAATLIEPFREGQRIAGLEKAIAACGREIGQGASESGVRLRDLALLKASVVIEDEGSAR